MSPQVMITAVDTELIKGLAKVCSRLNYNVLVERSKTRTLLSLLDKTIDFLIIDLDMCHDNEIEFIQLVRSTRPRLPIIVMAQDPDLETIRQILNLGIYYWTFKPIESYTFDRLLEALNQNVTKKL